MSIEQKPSLRQRHRLLASNAESRIRLFVLLTAPKIFAISSITDKNSCHSFARLSVWWFDWVGHPRPICISFISFQKATNFAQWESSVANMEYSTTRTQCEYHFLLKQKISLAQSANITLALREYHCAYGAIHLTKKRGTLVPRFFVILCY